MTNKWKKMRLRERAAYFRLLCRRKRLFFRNKKRSLRHEILPFRISREERVIAQIVGSRGYIQPVGVVRPLPKDSLVLALPKVFDFDDNYNESALLIAVFRRALIERKRISYIDFSRAQHVSPACVMVFTCYVTLWREFCPGIRPVVETWNPKVVKAFAQVGFFGFLGRDVKIPLNESTIDYMLLSSYPVDVHTQGIINYEIANIQRRIENFIGENLNRRVMYQSVSEAILNVYNHAYSAECPRRLSKKWWLSVSFDRVLRTLNISIFDHGLGIPRTMLDSSLYSWYKNYFYRVGRSYAEKDRLMLAFERLRNGINNRKIKAKYGGRGRGCKDILQMVSRNVAADASVVGNEINVVSSCARYRYKSTGNANDRGVAEALSVKLQGTLIEWRIKI